ncbi:MAG: peptide chain release factor N(5)-glutamine methyltransferase [Yoonia sp.]|uniref:peptide chain release factor N(5)-glutamine methyltransferase n=1 Tax=Yoonia sp. TaxID=2212373 RepID=UPI003EF65501
MSEDRLLREAAAELARAGVPDPQREVRILWRAVADQETFHAKIAERAQRKPLSQVLGYRDFYKHRFIVTADVLDPRPDTETLIEVALQHAAMRVLDLGTGSGCILLSLLDEWADAQGVGTDISPAALDVAGRNAAALGLDRRVTLLQSDWFAAVTGPFDLIVSNPPYIALEEMDALQPEVRLFEPQGALTDGADGLSAYRRIIGDAGDYLSPDGRLILEIGPTQGDAVRAMMADAGFGAVQVIPDLDGRDRVVSGQKPRN